MIIQLNELLPALSGKPGVRGVHVMVDKIVFVAQSAASPSYYKQPPGAYVQLFGLEDGLVCRETPDEVLALIRASKQ